MVGSDHSVTSFAEFTAILAPDMMLALLFFLVMSPTRSLGAVSLKLLTAVTTETFDYVVVGGGGGGSLMGSRLSEKVKKTVVVLELGVDGCDACDQSILADTRSELYNHYGDDRFTTPQLFNQRNLREIKVNLPGGTTRIYGHISLPTSKDVIDKHYPAGVGYKTLLPYFNKLQDHFCHYHPFNLTGINEADCAKYHGKKGGPMTISTARHSDLTFELSSDLKSIATKFGIKPTSDFYNPANQNESIVGDSQSFLSRDLPLDINSKRNRVSTWSGYLPPILRAKRKNLCFRTDAKVVELIYDYDVSPPKAPSSKGPALKGPATKGPKVVGVIYISKGQRHIIYARKQVILCAGIFGTVEILQQNGIGPADLLSSLQIPLVANNPHIGQKVSAHEGIPMAFQATKRFKIGPDTDGSSSLLLLKSPYSANSYPDIEIQIYGGIFTNTFEVATNGVPIEFISQFDPTAGNAFPFVTAFVTVVDPQWRGSLNITSATPGRNMKLDYGWPADFVGYASSLDYQKLKWAMNVTRSIMTGSHPLSQKWIAYEIAPGKPGPYSNQDTHDLLFAAYNQHSEYHITGGVALGSATDLEGRVKGVTGLTVCDNSLIPYAPNANPTTTMLALCEYVADKLKASTSY